MLDCIVSICFVSTSVPSGCPSPPFSVLSPSALLALRLLVLVSWNESIPESSSLLEKMNREAPYYPGYPPR